MSYGTSGDDYYGGQADENIVVFKGKSLYPVVDEQTGTTTWYERKGMAFSMRLQMILS